ncbi:MAG: phosphoribosylamine--glycine ligase [Acidobacteriaceae bacterium]
MKVLVIGGGGREHALVWSLCRSERVQEVVCAPGNAGIAALARCVPVDGNDMAATLEMCVAEQPDLVVIGPEVPLSLGLVDALQLRGVRVFGPTKAAAQLETSKSFAKEFMRRHGIATANYAVCTTMAEVRDAVEGMGAEVVVKADGLAAGKGVVICSSRAEAEAAAVEMFSGNLLGSKVENIVVEEFLAGEELSFFALCDGVSAVPIAAAQDHKRVGEGDTGPNTGGMGAYSSDALMGPELRSWLTEHVAQRVVDGMRAEGAEFRGVLFCGMMMVPAADGTVRPMVLEFNTRFGDPETEALMLRLETDVLDLLEASVDGTAHNLTVKTRPGASACVIAASGGYPGRYASGRAIAGLGSVAEDVVVFHCGTAQQNGALVTSGGRVLGVTAASEAGLGEALRKVYGALAGISFEGMQYRRDIGWRAMGAPSLRAEGQ